MAIDTDDGAVDHKQRLIDAADRLEKGKPPEEREPEPDIEVEDERAGRSLVVAASPAVRVVDAGRLLLHPAHGDLKVSGGELAFQLARPALEQLHAALLSGASVR